MRVFPLSKFATRRRLYPILEQTLLALGAFRAASSDLRRDPLRIIFVCSGNICRSPYAEACARQCGLPAVSCGTHAQSGSPADPTAIAEAAERGIGLSDHRAVRWRDVSLRRGDVVVAMTLRHVLIVLPRALMRRCDVLLLSSFLPQFAPIWDPYGRPRDFYRRVFDVIDIGVRHLAQWTNSALGATQTTQIRRQSRPDRDCGDGHV